METESEILKFVIVGSGNIAHHFANRITKKGFEIIQFVGRNQSTLKSLSEKYLAPFTSDLKKINKKADVILICVSDQSIEEVASKIRCKGKLILHVSGSTSIQALSKCSEKHGVLYPLQTFSKNKKVKWKDIPLIIEGNTIETENEIFEIAQVIGKKVLPLSESQRIKMHLSAVIVSNFSNHLYALTKNFLDREHSSLFNYLIPLIEETTQKITEIDPEAAQTGPARRKDLVTIKKHLDLLENDPELKNIYTELSNSIIHYYKK